MSFHPVMPGMRRIACVAAALLLATLFRAGAAPGAAAPGEDSPAPRLNPRCESIASKNLIRNASFECGTTHWSSLGKPTGWGGDLSGLHGGLDSGTAWHGAASLRIDLGPGITPVTCFDVWPPARVEQHAPLAANVGWMAVAAGQPLTLSAWMRASVPGTKARVLFRFAGSALKPVQQAEHEFTLSNEWTRYSVTQTALDEDVCVAIGPDMNELPGIAASFWLDAVQLESGSEATEFEAREPVELGVATGRYGNIYDCAVPVTLHVSGSNQGDQDTSVQLTLALEDYFGSVLPGATLRVELPRGRPVAVPWQIAVPGKGHYRASVAWNANDRDHAQSVVFAVIEPYPHDDSPFGLNHPATTRQQLHVLSKAGIRWVRTWAVNWEWVEPVQGQVSWTAPDAQLEHITAAGMKPLIVFPNPSTSWATSAPSSVENRLWYRLAYAPVAPERLFEFIGNAVDRYRDSCTYWEFLNEPLWVPDFCLPQSAGYQVGDYIELLQGAYRAIKAEDPDATVLGGLAIEPKHLLGDEFLSSGGLAHCDILNLHPYGGLTPPEEFIAQFERIQDAMRASGHHKPIWATETAYYAVDNAPWTPWLAPPGHFSAGLLLPSERTAADYLVRHAIIMLAHGTGKIFYHEPIEGPVNAGAMDIENTFLGPDAVPRKSYAALAALANLLGPSPVYAGRFPAAAGANTYGFAFQCGGRAVLAAWVARQEEESERVALTVPNESTACDVMGNPLTGTILTLTESPLYVESATLTAEALLAASAP